MKLEKFLYHLPPKKACCNYSKAPCLSCNEGVSWIQAYNFYNRAADRWSENIFMQKSFLVTTRKREELIDITSQVKNIVSEAKAKTGLVNIYVRGATAAIMIQENWDESVQNDVISFLKKIIPRGVWEHDQQDGNGDSHLKSGLISPSETIPIIDGEVGLSTWQNVFLCEFDGPRLKREIVVTVISF